MLGSIWSDREIVLRRGLGHAHCADFACMRNIVLTAFAGMAFRKFESNTNALTSVESKMITDLCRNEWCGSQKRRPRSCQVTTESLSCKRKYRWLIQVSTWFITAADEARVQAMEDNNALCSWGQSMTSHAGVEHCLLC